MKNKYCSFTMKPQFGSNNNKHQLLMPDGDDTTTTLSQRYQGSWGGRSKQFVTRWGTSVPIQYLSAFSFYILKTNWGTKITCQRLNLMSETKDKPFW